MPCVTGNVMPLVPDLRLMLAENAVSESMVRVVLDPNCAAEKIMEYTPIGEM